MLVGGVGGSGIRDTMRVLANRELKNWECEALLGALLRSPDRVELDRRYIYLGTGEDGDLWWDKVDSKLLLGGLGGCRWPY